MKKILLLPFVIFSINIIFCQEAFIRFPSISPDGKTISFSYQGDIWTANINGSNPKRLTVHEGYEKSPIWSPDGSKIAFESSRFGNSDIFVMTKSGTDLKRLTYHSTSDGEIGWSGNEAVTFSTRRAYLNVERAAEIYTVPISGGTPQRLLGAVGTMAEESPDGSKIAFVRGGCRVTREAYVGPAQRDIWIYHKASDSYQQITHFEGQDIDPQWGDNQTLYFLSARTGRYNIYSVGINADGSGDATKAKRITNFKDAGIRNYDVSPGSKFAVYERKMGGASLDLSNKRSNALSIQTPQDDRFDSYENSTSRSGGGSLSLSPNGKNMAFVVRGEVFVKKIDKEKTLSINVSNHPFRDMSPVWKNDTTLLFVSDRGGNYDIYEVMSADTSQPELTKSLKRSLKQITFTSEDERDLSVSPDGSKLATAIDRGKLVIQEIDSLGEIGPATVLHDGWNGASGLSWSPDSKYLAYSMSNLNFNSEIYIHPVDNSFTPINISMHPRGDNNPVWSPDGSKLGFTSIRNNGDADVWFAWLKKSDWEKSKTDWEEDEEEEETKPKPGKKKETKPKVEIDFKNIHERLVQVTSSVGNEGNLAISKDGQTFYFTTNGSGRTGGSGKREFKSIKWDGSESKTVMPDGSISGVQFDKSATYLYYASRRGFGRLKVKGGKPESLPYSAKMKIDFSKEKQQVYNEGWKVLDQGFYDPDFHGQDWSKLRDKYKPWAMATSTKQDFYDIFNELLGQVNASHMGMFGGTPEETQRERTGYLGVEVKPHVQGAEVTKVVINTPADKERSKLNVGDVIIGVNGVSLSSESNLNEQLLNTANEKVLLNVLRNGENTEIVIRPTSSIRTSLYEEWVKERKELTNRYSGGKLGYIHIQGMNWPSFERFERELMASGDGKEGIVIDVRFNGGGWTTDMLMAVLNVKQHAYTIPRGAANSLKKENLDFKKNYPFGERLPLSSWTKPSIAICNESSYSNAEIFSHAYKHLGIGTLVGMPTFGAVISTGGYGLMDGSFVRMPFRAWYVYHTEENMELGPAIPDIIVEDPPDSKAKGEDLQLKAAVDELLKQIQN